MILSVSNAFKFVFIKELRKLQAFDTYCKLGHFRQEISLKTTKSHFRRKSAWLEAVGPSDCRKNAIYPKHACVSDRFTQNLSSQLCYRAKPNRIVKATCYLINSGFPSARINLSPFTKDFRGGEQLNESVDQFFRRPAL